MNIKSLTTKGFNPHAKANDTTNEIAINQPRFWPGVIA